MSAPMRPYVMRVVLLAALASAATGCGDEDIDLCEGCRPTPTPTSTAPTPTPTGPTVTPTGQTATPTPAPTLSP
jgi:hypothetical protein